MIVLDHKRITEIKAGLLCLGVNVDKEVGAKLLKARPYFYDKGFVHAVNANIMGSNVCVSVAEEFSGVSPYHLVEKNDHFFIKDENDDLVPIRLFDDLPKTNTIVDELARPHSDHVISLWPSLVCCFDTPGRKCKFCSIKITETQTVVPAQEVVNGLKELFKLTDKYEINLGGGTYGSPDQMVLYLTEIIKGIREFTNNGISVELAPPKDLSLLTTMHDAGASSLIMNLEIADPVLRKAICPGKSEITYEHYYEAYRHAVSIFGRGKVSCVLIAGIQPNDDIVNECQKLINIGVVPTIIPFKAMDDCEFHNHDNCHPQDLLYVAKKVGKMLKDADLSPNKQTGCTECGGCSLETNFFNAQ